MLPGWYPPIAQNELAAWRRLVKAAGCRVEATAETVSPESRGKSWTSRLSTPVSSSKLLVVVRVRYNPPSKRDDCIFPEFHHSNILSQTVWGQPITGGFGSI